MKCFSVVIGARQTPAGGARFSREQDEEIRAITFRHFPAGFTILHADGGWFDPEQRRFISEQSRQILVCAQRRAALDRWCRELAAALRQKELLVVELGGAHLVRPLPSPAHRGSAPAVARERRRRTNASGRTRVGHATTSKLRQ